MSRLRVPPSPRGPFWRSCGTSPPTGSRSPWGSGRWRLVLRQIPGAPAPLGLLATESGCSTSGSSRPSRCSMGRAGCSFRQARRVFAHPVMSMFLGTIPMGLATIVNGFVLFGPGVIGLRTDVAFGLWILDALLAVACGLAVPFLMFTRQHATASSA